MSEITSELLKKIAPSTPKAKRDRFIPYFNSILPKYGVTTKKRVSAFLATVVMESDYLKATEEYADGWAYDVSRNKKKARELGNTEVGDGPKYKGRTLIQTTGKDNYQRVSDELGVDFVANPKWLAKPNYAVEGACIFWRDNKLNSYSDRGQFGQVEGIVNRGSKDKVAKDFPKRQAIYNILMKELTDDFDLTVGSDVPQEDTPSENNISIEKTENATVNTDGSGDVTVISDKTDITADTVVMPKSDAPAKIAVVASRPPKFFERIRTKVVAAVTGNVFFQWVSDKLTSLTGINLSPEMWWAIIITVAIGTISWLVWEMIKVHQEKNRQKDLDKLLVEQNSTATNTVQLIPADEVDIYKAKNYKIITRGQVKGNQLSTKEADDDTETEDK